MLRAAAHAVAQALGELGDWGLAGTRPWQYRSDLAADAAALAVLEGAGLGVLSEESGRHHPGRTVTVVVDPLDGSTNAARGIPWFATSLCAVDRVGPLAAVVVNLVSGSRFEAVRDGGATCDGAPLVPGDCQTMKDAMVALSGFPPQALGWMQYRSLGAAALDLCAVAAGVVDAFIDCSPSALGPWDYLGGLLVCQEAGAPVVDAGGRELVVLGHDSRRTPVAACNQVLLDEVALARASFLW